MIELDPTFIHRTVVEIWADILKLSHVDLTQRWDDAGGDSLGAMQLLLKLEKVLGLKFPFETIQPGTSVGDLIASCEDYRTPLVGHIGPRVFFLPGLFGYEPILRDMQVQLRDELTLDILELPDLMHLPAALSDLGETGRIVADEIERRQPERPIFLGGFCFGGAVAYEAAASLLSTGRQIAFLGIVDTRFWSPSWDRPSEPLIGLRVLALRGWRPKPITHRNRPTTTLLAASDKFLSHAEEDAWRTIVPELRAFVLPGGHADILRSSLPSVVAIFRQALAATDGLDAALDHGGLVESAAPARPSVGARLKNAALAMAHRWTSGTA